MKTREIKLRKTLKRNALFSLISGLTLLIFPASIAPFMNLTNDLPMTIIGAGLVLFVMFTLFVAYQKTIRLILVKIIIIQDTLWVAGSIILLLTNPFEISNKGSFVIAIIAIAVLYFSFQQRKFSK